MAFLVMAYDALNIPRDHPDFVTARRAVDKLLVRKRDGGYCQPCVSPVWDTSLAAHALMEAGESPDGESVRGALDWLIDRQILDTVGDWADGHPNPPRPGGWAFQYGNAFYPDVDDTAVVGMALHRAGDERHREAWERAAEWVIERARAGLGPIRWLGRLGGRQHPCLPEPHPVCRSRSPAGPANGGCFRPLRGFSSPNWPWAGSSGG